MTARGRPDEIVPPRRSTRQGPTIRDAEQVGRRRDVVEKVARLATKSSGDGLSAKQRGSLGALRRRRDRSSSPRRRAHAAAVAAGRRRNGEDGRPLQKKLSGALDLEEVLDLVRRLRAGMPRSRSRARHSRAPSSGVGFLGGSTAPLAEGGHVAAAAVADSAPKRRSRSRARRRAERGVLVEPVLDRRRVDDPAARRFTTASCRAARFGLWALQLGVRSHGRELDGHRRPGFADAVAAERARKGSAGGGLRSSSRLAVAQRGAGGVAEAGEAEQQAPATAGCRSSRTRSACAPSRRRRRRCARRRPGCPSVAEGDLWCTGGSVADARARTSTNDSQPGRSMSIFGGRRTSSAWGRRTSTMRRESVGSHPEQRRRGRRRRRRRRSTTRSSDDHGAVRRQVPRASTRA